MSKAKFAAAKELIDEKKYGEARAILKTIDHPTAQNWLEKLDKIDPVFQPIEPESWTAPASSNLSKQTNLPAKNTSSIPKKANRRIYNLTRGCLVIVAALVVLSLLTNRSSSPTSSVIPTADNTQIAFANATSTAESISDAATSTIIALTPPTETPTVAPSATITDTPIPSATPTLTNTPTEAPTSTPTKAPFGTKANPYPVGAPGNVRDGRLQVNQFLRNQTATIKQMNMFNSDPPIGGEWAIVNVTFYCDLPSAETCNVSLMNLELTGKLGSIYTKELFVVMDNDFTGEVFGGGQLTGNVGFMINSTDTSFVFVVNDLGDRAFFTAGN